MKIDLSQFIGKCECGKTHGMDIRKILLEPGALEQVPQVISELGLSGKAAIICDRNTWNAAGKRVSRLLPEHHIIMIERDSIHPDERLVADIENMLPSDIDSIGYIVGVGGGVITDTAKYIGKHHGGIPVVLIPTAASVDGFAANSSIMTFNNFKHPLTTQSAAAIIADTNVLCAAPYRLTASGLGDLLGKYIALADWKIASLVTGEAVCPRIYGMVDEALMRAVKVIDKVKENDPDAIEALMYALILSGLTIQMWGNSRPASGAEHMLAHVWELALFSPDTGFLHGETVGVGTVICKKLYEKLIEAVGERPREFFVPYKGFPHESLREKLGEIVYAELMPYNNPDEGTMVDYEKLIASWGEICRICADMPDSAEMERIFRDLGVKSTLEDLGISADILPVTLEVGSFVRGRMTLFRIWERFSNIGIDLR
ncbi:MAG: sn-glycerol-1-phosphate dehydrogenase [Oscillospiraceae bacterium]|nr:sn-glycerol-1-phosphate dehydrogenase [Oscillospiraceae bacterium]